MTQLLASVRSPQEARIALSEAIGILDLKEPEKGALGALTAKEIKQIVSLAHNKCAVSATVGDLPPDAKLVADIIEQWISCGVDYIKIGFFNSDYFETYPAILKQYAKRSNLIAVLFADRIANLEGPCHLLAAAGCKGIMLDTADKNTSSIRTLLDDKTLKQFIDTTRDLSLLCGIAGSLTKEDIPPLVNLKPDYLGFRTALCEHRQRNGDLSQAALSTLLKTMTESHHLIAA